MKQNHRIRRRGAAGVAAFAVAFTALSSAAIVVSSVSVKPVDGFGGDTTDISLQCRVKPGQTFSADAVQQDVRALTDSQRYEKVVAETVETKDGMEVVYSVQRKRRFKGPLAVEGAKYFTESKIARLSKLTDGASLGESDLAAAAGYVRRAYVRKFFPDAKVETKVEPIPGSPGAVNVKMTVDEGKRLRLGDYTFSGNKAIEASELRAAFGWYPWYNPMGWMSDDPAADDELDAAAAAVAARYRKAGYLDAKVPRPVRVPRPDGKTDFLFKVEEGTLYKVGAISFEGVTNLTAAAKDAKGRDTTVEKLLREAAENAMAEKLSPDEAEARIAGEEALREAEKAVEMYFGSRGIVDTEVSTVKIPAEKDPSVLDLVFKVKPGKPGYIHDIVVRGNDRTMDKVIRREIRLSPKDPYDERSAERARKRLENLGYFSRVQQRLEKPAGYDPEAEKLQPYVTRDLVYEVTEQSTGNFGIGVGASSVDSVFGYVEISESNFDLFRPWRFSGAGQKARMNISVGPRIQTYEVSLTEPWFLDRQLEFTLEGYRRLRWYDQYDVARSGFSATISYPVKFWPTWDPFGRLGFRFTLDYVQMYDVDDGMWGYAKGFDPAESERDTRLYKIEERRFDESVEAIFRLFWADNTLDHPYFPHHGYSALLFGDVSTGDNKYWRLGATWRQYFTVSKRWDHVFSWRVHAETVDEISGDLPIYDRLFLGGPRSVRGVDYREVSPKIYRKGEHSPWGGKAAFCATAEYTVPVIQYIRLAAFTDLGAVGKDTFDPEFSDLCWSVGLGIRLDIPRFPVRLDFAVPVSKPSDVDREVFSFSVGYDF